MVEITTKPIANNHFAQIANGWIFKKSSEKKTHKSKAGIAITNNVYSDLIQEFFFELINGFVLFAFIICFQIFFN